MTEFTILDGHAFLALTTFDSAGQPVTKPFAFARVDDRVYIMAPASADEVRHVHANAQVEVAPCAADGQPLGAPLEAMALALAGDEAEPARRALRRKYGLRTRLDELSLFFQRERCVYLEITPM